MELLQLTYFLDAAKEENFSRTAKKFLVPPSAVSQSIKRLEEELSVPLFERSANRVRLNEQGRVFFERIGEGMRLIEEAKELVTAGKRGGRIKLSIFINRRIVMQTVERFRMLFPDVDIVTKYSVLPEAEPLDLIVTDGSVEGAKWAREEMLTEDILLAVRDDHPLAAAEEITPEKLAAEPFICTNKDSSLYNITQKICAGMGFSPRIVICSDDPYYIRKCIELGLGVSLIPSTSWRGQFSEHVVLRRVGDHRRTTFVYRSDAPAPAVREFLRLLGEESAEEAMASDRQK
jgi:DNA-binding transcriptional LysR family regulator